MEEDQHQQIVQQLKEGKKVAKFKWEHEQLWYQRNKDWAKVVLRGFTEEIMKQYHSNPLAGHFSKDKTLKAIRKDYYWPRQNEEVTAYVQSCYVCQSQGRKKRNNQPTGIMTSGVWERVGIDFIGPLPVTTQGNRYIITAMDYFTHWPEARAVPEANAEQAARFIYEDIICRHGIVDIIQTDQGTHFKNQLITELVERFQIKHHIITAYHPQANGLIERFNGTLKKSLAKIANETNEWDKYIHPTLFAYRTHHVESIGTTPAFLENGRELRLPGNMTSRQTTWERLDFLIEKMPLILENVIPKLKKAKERDQRRHKVKVTQFKVGDQVMIYNETATPLSPKWTGPVTLIRKFDNGTYAYELPNRKQSKAINGDRLKLFKDRLQLEPIVVIEK